MISKRYGYDKNGEVALTKANLEQTDISKDYQKVTVSGSEKEWNSYVYTFDEDGYRYNLAYNGRQFYTFQHTDDYVNGTNKVKRRINAYAKGDPLNGDFNSSNFQSQVDIQFGKDSDNYDTKTPWIQAEVKGTNATALKYKILSADLTENGNWLDTVVRVKKTENGSESAVSTDKTLKEVLENAELPFKDFISISDDVKNVNGYITDLSTTVNVTIALQEMPCGVILSVRILDDFVFKDEVRLFLLSDEPLGDIPFC